MTKVLIVYASDHGGTEKMARAIAKGAEDIQNVQAIVRKAEEATKEETVGADALVLGSPVHMGSPDWRVKKFIDSICSGLWMENAMIGKVGAVFACGSGYGNGGGGCELTMLAMMNNLVELGLLIVPLPKNTPGYEKSGLQWGPYGRAHDETMKPVGLKDEQLESSRHHGMHIARVATLMAQETVFTG